MVVIGKKSDRIELVFDDSDVMMVNLKRKSAVWVEVRDEERMRDGFVDLGIRELMVRVFPERVGDSGVGVI